LQEVTDLAIKILIVSDNQMICAGIRMIFATESNMLVIGEVAKAGRAVEVAAHVRPQIVLIDLDLFSIDVARLIHDLQKAAEQSLPLVLGSLRNGDLTRIALCSGAAGIVLTVQPPAVVIAAIASLCSGDLQIERQRIEPASFILNDQHLAKTPDHKRTKICDLTLREREIVGLIGKGLSNKDIADRLCISDITVRHHLTNIYSKLDVSNRQKLLILAHQYGLIEPTLSSGVTLQNQR
jgi:DNA-binding NarL/FixJ family response regulator